MLTHKTLRTLTEEFVLYKRSLGYAYETHEYSLLNYVAYAESISQQTCFPDKETVLGYLGTLSNLPGALYNATAVLREFGKYLVRQGISAYVIPPKSTPALDPEPPYFFTECEINSFFEACDTIKKHLSFPGREFVFPAMFRLLYCCGLRCKEARTLLCENVYLDDCYFDIMQSKGPKSRRIYISHELSVYLKGYNNRINNLFPNRTYFFPHKESTCYDGQAITKNFWRFWSLAFPDFVRASRPRAYDFRHHFVWKNLNRWAAEGLDANVMLPYLSRYMGHQNINSTLYYFRFVPDFFSDYSDMVQSSESVLPEVPYEE